MFVTIEDIRFITDTMYGKYTEAIFDPPIIAIFTNENLNDHLNNLSPVEARAGATATIVCKKGSLSNIS